MATFTHVFAERDNLSGIIDVVDPVTGRSAIQGETLAEIRERYPTAELIEYADFAARKAAAQDAPIVWSATTAEKYADMLNVLPPAVWLAIGFLVGEPCDHHAATGRPRFAAYVHVNGQYFTASRPLTVQEFRALTAADVLKGGR